MRGGEARCGEAMTTAYQFGRAVVGLERTWEIARDCTSSPERRFSASILSRQDGCGGPVVPAPDATSKKRDLLRFGARAEAHAGAKYRHTPRLWGGRRRAVRAAPSLHAAEAALRGAQARPGPLKSRQTGGGGGVLGQRGRRGLVSLSRRAPCRLAAAHELSELLDCDVPRALGNGRAWVTEGVGRDAGAPRELRETI